MTWSPIQKVALAGATGNLGPAILKALLAAGFTVTVLTRTGSTRTQSSTFSSDNPNVRVAAVDYDSAESLTAALKGHDALISTLGTHSSTAQEAVIEAAAAAGVPRVIPSEFGSDTFNPGAAKMPVFAGKVATEEQLARLAKEHPSTFSYTSIITGPFLDWGLKVGFFGDYRNRIVDLYDGGDRRFSVTTLAGIGRAVVGVLRHPEETANRAVYVCEAVVTQNQLIGIVDKINDDKTKTWTLRTVDTAETERWAFEELAKDPSSTPPPNIGGAMYAFIRRVIFGGHYGAEFEKVENDLVSLKALSDEEIEEVVRSVVAN